MESYNKYHKYKSKYLKAKNNAINKQRGGSPIFPLNDDIHFWGRQVTEHLLILYLGLEDNGAKLKQKAFDLHAKWKNFMMKNFYDKGINVTNSTIVLTADDLAKVGNINVDLWNDLIGETIAFNDQLIQILSSGKWIGWIFQGIVEHMQDETKYYQRKVNGPPYTPKEEGEFSNKHHSGEIGASANLINPEPSQQKIIDVARSYALKKMAELNDGHSLTFEDPPKPFPKNWTPQEERILAGLDPAELATFIQISLKFSKELEDFGDDTRKKVDSGELNSVINPVLAHHVYREFVRFSKTLEAVNK